MSHPRISAVVICGNEEANIGDCLDSVTWCDEIVVVDSMSTDRTAEIARRFTDKVLQRPWPGYVAQKNFALEQATGDWIVSLDADERCTPELREELLRVLAEADGIDGFLVKRHVHYLGRWINHGGWYPDYKLRIVRRGRARWTGDDPHDKLVTEGRTRDLEGELTHTTYRDFAHQLRVIGRFSDIVVDGWIRKGRPPSLFKALFHPPIKFLECYVWKLGFLDGWPGFVIAAASAFYVFTKHVKHRERMKTVDR
ncbi:MAG: glycosyltransferase family 2 protein [Planctomycetes bacterium]|nr:glycosyltransferase family 2 protein [Planctomycetota bacterium]